MQTIEVDATASTKTAVDYSQLIWETEKEPPYVPSEPAKLLHLYSISGLVMIGYWPKDGLIGEHFMAWAYIDQRLDGGHYTVH